MQTKVRNKTIVEANGGTCNGKDYKEEKCNEQACPGMIIISLTRKRSKIEYDRKVQSMLRAYLFFTFQSVVWVGHVDYETTKPR